VKDAAGNIVEMYNVGNIVRFPKIAYHCVELRSFPDETAKRGDCMDGWIALAVSLAGYLLGGMSFPRLIARLAAPKTEVQGVEIAAENGDRLRPSGMGATTVSAVLGWKVGCAASLLDMAKIFLPVLALRLVYPDQPYFLLLAFFGVVGNNWPIYHGFKGGWGISAIYGGLFAIDPLGASVTLLLSFVLGILLKDWMILFLSSIWLMVPWLWFRTQDLGHLIYIVGVNLAMFIALLPETRIYLKNRSMARIEDGGLASQVPMGRGLIKMMSMLKMQRKN
jgi:glycerol-3-phosphate acyltransferase PlsY